MRTYELMMIHRPELAETDVRSQIDDVESAIAEAGSIKASDFWGKRRFAYEVENSNEGYYSVLEFEADPPIIDRLDRSLALSDSVLRYKFIRTRGE